MTKRMKSAAEVKARAIRLLREAREERVRRLFAAARGESEKP